MLRKIDVFIVNVLILLCFVGLLALEFLEAAGYHGGILGLFF